MTAYEMRISDWSSDVCSSDLAAQKPVAELLGGIRRTRMPILYMLATGDLGTDVADAKAKKDAGVVAMKIKVGSRGAVEADIERTREIRKAVNGGVQLSADANQGWSRGEALAFVRGAGGGLGSAAGGGRGVQGG